MGLRPLLFFLPLRERNSRLNRKNCLEVRTVIIGLKIFMISVGVYASVRLSGIAIEWLREAFDYLRPKPPKR